MHWFAVYLYLYAIGIMAGIALVPWKFLGRPFFSVNALIASVLAIIATAVAQPLMHGIPRGTMELMSHVMALGLLAITLIVTFAVRVSGKPLRAEMFYLPVSMGAIYVAFLAIHGAPVHAAVYVLHYLATAALLGSTMVAMILGHWYLQDASLPFELLGRLAKFYLVAAVARLAASVLNFLVLRPPIPDLLTDFDGVLVLVRVGAGIIASIVLALMVRSCVKVKSNQSATGILYVAVVFALIGEAMSMYLTLNRGAPAVNVTAYCRKCLYPGKFDASAPPEQFECARCGDFVPISVTDDVRANRRLDRCPVCASAYFYREKDFNAWIGGAIILTAAVAFLVLAGRNIGLALGILLAAAALDFAVYLAVPFRYVCYKCLASIHGAPPDSTIGTYDLGTAGRFADDYDDHVK